MKKKLLVVLITAITTFCSSGSVSALTATQLYKNASNNIFFYVDDSDACNPSSLAEYVASVTGDQMTWIGDAWSVYAKKVIETRYPGISVYAESGRSISESGATESGIEVAKRLASGNVLRKYVAFMLGTNGGANKTEDEVKTMINELMSAVGEDRMVVLMTARTRTREYDDFNKAVKAMASDNEKILVADWAEASKDKIDEYFEEGKDSLNEKGLNALVAVVANTLDTYTSSKNQNATSTVGASLGETTSHSGTVDTSTIESRALYVAERLKGAGYNGNAIAAFLGNFQAEDGLFDGGLTQKGCGKNLGIITDVNWKITNSDWGGYPGHCGLGIAQWTSGGRQKGLQSFAEQYGLPVINLEAQTGWVLSEASTSYKNSVGVAVLNEVSSLAEATWKVYKNYESPASSTNVSSLVEAQNYEPFTARLRNAEKWLQLIEANGIAQGSGIVWDGSGGGSVGSNGAICSTNMRGSTGLAQLAREMSWPDDNGVCLDSSGGIHQWSDKSNRRVCYPNPRAKYKDVVNELKAKGINIPKFMDCSYFIASVVRYSGLDDKWPAPGGSEPAWRYVNSKSGQELWALVENLGNSSNLMPGDIFTYPRANGKAGHVMMYIGEYGGKFGNMAGASLDSNVAIIGNIYFKHADNGSGAGTKFTISRYTGGATMNFDLGTSGDYSYDDTTDDGDGDIDTGGSESTVVTSKNSCGSGKVSTGKTYADVKTTSDVVIELSRVVERLTGGNGAYNRAVASYILITYEREAGTNASESGLREWLGKKYQATVTQYARNATNVSDATKNTIQYLLTSGTRTLPANTVEMLAPSGASWIKKDGTNATKLKGSVIDNNTLLQLEPGVAKATIKGYSSDLTLYCGMKDSAGNYSYLFWQKDSTPAGQEVQ